MRLCNKSFVIRETHRELLVRRFGVVGDVGSMITEMIDLDRKIAGFGNLILELVRALEIPTPGVPVPSPPDNCPNE